MRQEAGRIYFASLVDGLAASFHSPSSVANLIEQAFKRCSEMWDHKSLRQSVVYPVQQGGQLGAQPHIPQGPQKMTEDRFWANQVQISWSGKLHCSN